jgi:predicted RNA methylase/DNA-directed RNA polymerase subunit RPC12/RpoP
MKKIPPPRQSDLDLSPAAQDDGPVECFGQTFPSDAARREHYLGLLRDKLKDPKFRKLPGFPIGADEDILALSDPPYYTACPNPWISEFLAHCGKANAPKKGYHREPYAADVTEGKNHPIYSAHSYHTKVPHRAIMRYILHYTEPGDVVFDGFCGTGMMGVAAQLCADRKEIQELGYQVDGNGTITSEGGKTVSKLGPRRAVMNDLSPAATFIASNYNLPVDTNSFHEAAERILQLLKEKIGWMYETRHTDGTSRMIDYTVWSELYTCPECGGEMSFLTEALDPKTKRVRDEFPCPHCSSVLTKRKVERVFESSIDPKLGTVWKRVKFQPCLIQYRVGNQKYEKAPDSADLEVLRKIESMEWPASIPSNAWPIEEMYHGSRIEPKGFNHTHQFFLTRPAMAIGRLWEEAHAEPDFRVRMMLLFFVEQAIWGMSRMARYAPTHFSQVNRYLSGVFYISAQHAECAPWYILDGKLSRLIKAFEARWRRTGTAIVATDSAGSIQLPDNSIDYIFTDPPFGANIPYADLNLVVESWHKVWTNTDPEAIIDTPKRKGLGEYKQLMLDSFKTYYRALKPGRWITVEFSNSQASVWNVIQATMQEAGFVVANVSALDKKQGSFRSVTTPTAVKQDLVISAYKPNGQLELNFSRRGDTQEGPYDFVDYHLAKLPLPVTIAGEMSFVTERDPRILFDRTVAFYVGHGVPVPLSSPEFQAGLKERYAECDGMVFLTEQIPEVHARRSAAQDVGQLTVFVEDERTAITWLQILLRKRPSIRKDFSNEFLKQLNASWKNWEERPDLDELLQQNFLRYDGDGPVPSQIHSYLSSNYHAHRGKKKDDPLLIHEAKHRWYVPDPSKEADMEALRNRRLLTEFWGYFPPTYRPAAMDEGSAHPSLPGIGAELPKISKKEKLKTVRKEAVRVGFKHCLAKKDHVTILVAKQVIPDAVIEEDEILLMQYDIAVTRTGYED